MTAATVTKGANNYAGSVHNFATGSFSVGAGDAVDVSVALGFKPRYIKIVDETNALIWEKLETQAAANVVKYLPGTTGSNDTITEAIVGGSLIAITDSGFTVSATIAAASSSFAWIALA